MTLPIDRLKISFERRYRRSFPGGLEPCGFGRTSDTSSASEHEFRTAGLVSDAKDDLKMLPTQS